MHVTSVQKQMCMRATHHLILHTAVRKKKGELNVYDERKCVCNC